MLDLRFTDEQDMLRDAVRGLVAGACPLTRVRELEDDSVGFDVDLWRQLAEMDLVGLLLPAQHGGSGMTLLEGVVLYEELGRAVVPTPHFVSAVMAGGVLARAGSETQQATWLPRIARGEAILSTAWLEPGNGYTPRGVQATAMPDGGDMILTGTKWHVPFASSAERLVMLARTGPGDADLDVFLVDPAAPGVTLTQQHTIASDCQYAVTFTDVRVPATDRIGDAGSGWATWDDTMHDGAILLAAEAIGAARFAHEITTQYAKDRKQFDKPLGAFQALAHDLADAITAIDGGEILVHEAAWAAANGHDIRRLAPMAKLFACDTFRDTTAMAQQIFGGVGFTLEYDIQLYFRRAKSWQLSWWDSAACEDRIAAEVLDTVG